MKCFGIRAVLSAAVLATVMGLGTQAWATVYLPTRDTSITSAWPTKIWGTLNSTWRVEKGGDPYWDVAGGSILIDFDRAAILNQVETGLGHPGVSPTLAEMSGVSVKFSVMLAGDPGEWLESTVAVPGVMMSPTNWSKTQATYQYANAGSSLQWQDQDGANVANVRTVLQHNDWMAGGVPRNAAGQTFTSPGYDTYTTFTLDPAVALCFLTGVMPNPADGVKTPAGLILLTDGPEYGGNNVGAYLANAGAGRTPFLEVTVPEPVSMSMVAIGSLALLRRRRA